MAEGLAYSVIQGRLQTTRPTISRWKQRTVEAGVEGLDIYHPGQKAIVLTPALRAKILGGHAQKTERRVLALELPQAGCDA